MQSKKRIAIVGGGPGGLTLARILHQHGMDCTVFEAEESPRVRSQGGSLDLHPDGGQMALDRAGLRDAFLRYARYDDQYDALYDHHGTLHCDMEQMGDGERPEIDRAQLRDLLLASVPPESIRWNSRLSTQDIARMRDESRSTTYDGCSP